MTRRYVYYYIYYSSLPNFILKKTDLIGFFKIKPRHPDELRKNRSGWKNPAMGALASVSEVIVIFLS